MGNNYALEAELLKKSRVMSRAPSTITSDPITHIQDYDKCQCGCKKLY